MFHGYNMLPNNSPNNFYRPYQTISLIEPYVVETLKSIIGRRVIVDTVRGTVQGTLVDVKPDHIVIKDRKDDEPTFVRMQQIVFVMPIR